LFINGEDNNLKETKNYTKTINGAIAVLATLEQVPA